MSLFLFQQKIPFESVSEYLRVFEPGSPINPNDWARTHLDDIAAGDLIFIFEPMYSPWSDSSSGIGVAEGDSFNVAAIAIAYKMDDGLTAFVIYAENFERCKLQDYLAQQVQTAKTNGGGFYYALARSPVGIPPEVVRDLAELDSFGNSGRRQDESQPIDILYAFFTAASWGVEVHPGQQPDIAQIGYCIFCDKEPPAGSNVPDLRAHVQPVDKNQKRKNTSAAQEVRTTAAAPAPAPAPALPAPKQIQIPKIPSFFKQGKQQGGDGRGKPRIIGPAGSPAGQKSTGASLPAGSDSSSFDPEQTAQATINAEQMPLQSQSPAAAPLDQPAAYEPSAAHQNLEETDQVPALDANEVEQYAAQSPALNSAASAGQMAPPMSGQMAPPMSGQMAPPMSGQMTPPMPGQMTPPMPGQMAPPMPGQMAPPMPGQMTPPMPGQMTPPLPDQSALPLPGQMPPPLPGQMPLPGQTPPPLPAAAGQSGASSLDSTQPGDTTAPTQSPSPGIDWAQMLSEEPVSATVKPQVQQPSVRPGRAGSQPTPQPPTSQSAPPALPASSTGTPTGQGDPDAAPAPASPPVASAGGSAPVPATAAAQEIPSLAELLGNIGRAADNAALAQAAAASDTADGDTSLVAAGPPAKKKVDPELQNRLPKEQVQVKSGVAGLVSKLEQQASKASNRLEGQVDEIQNSLTRELSELLAKVTSAENRSARNAQDLAAELSERLDGATTQIAEKITVAARDGSHRIRQHEDEGGIQLASKHEDLRTTLNAAFDEVRTRAESIVKKFEENLAKDSAESSLELDTLKDSLTEQLSGLYGSYELILQTAFDAFHERLESANSSIAATVESRYSLLQGQLAELQARYGTRLEQIRQSYVSQLNKQFAVAQSDVRKLRATSLEETVIPRLRQHREELRQVISEFQSKLAEDLEVKGEEKLAEFEPALAEKKMKLAEVLHATTAVKDALEETLRERLQSIADELKLFVETGVEQAQTAFKDTEEQLGEIDRAVRALADPSSIEGDLELLNERNQVLAAMDEATEKDKDGVLSTLRTSVAGLEEKGKQLQEELISSMEEDAYRVRRASEQALHDIREAIKQAFAAIQTAQDERMPM